MHINSNHRLCTTIYSRIPPQYDSNTVFQILNIVLGVSPMYLLWYILILSSSVQMLTMANDTFFRLYRSADRDEEECVAVYKSKNGKEEFLNLVYMLPPVITPPYNTTLYYNVTLYSDFINFTISAQIFEENIYELIELPYEQDNKMADLYTRPLVLDSEGQKLRYDVGFRRILQLFPCFQIVNKKLRAERITRTLKYSRYAPRMCNPDTFYPTIVDGVESSISCKEVRENLNNLNASSLGDDETTLDYSK